MKKKKGKKLFVTVMMLISILLVISIVSMNEQEISGKSFFDIFFEDEPEPVIQAPNGFSVEGIIFVETPVKQALSTDAAESVPVIIKLKEIDQEFYTYEKDMPTLKQEAEILQNQVISTLTDEDFKLKRKYETVKLLSGELTQEGLEKLSQNPKVEKITIDYEFGLALSESTKLIKSDIANSMKVNNQIKGQGVSICVIDSGVNYQHSALQNRIISQKCFCKTSNGFCCPNQASEQSGPGSALDDNGHGSACAGIIASNNQEYQGVAPQTNIVAVKACDFNEKCTASDVIAGIDWCIDNKNDLNIMGIVMSLSDGEEHNDNNCPDYINDILELAETNNLPIFVASGNEHYTNGISYPACSPYSISVGSVDDSGSKKDKVSDLTNRGSNLDLLAPGVRITTLSYEGNSFTTWSGTSMAAPHVAGAAALFVQAYKESKNEFPSINLIKQKLQTTSVGILDEKTGLSFPRIDTYNLLSSLTLPEITIISPEIKQYKDKNMQLEITSNKELNNAWFSLNSEEKIEMLPETDKKFTFNLELEKGTYQITFYIIDKQGNVNSATTAFSILEVINPDKLFGNFQIKEQEGVCGDSICNIGEGCGNCPQDCGVCPEVSSFSSSGEICVEHWNCLEWSKCVDGKQSRTCFDENRCKRHPKIEEKECLILNTEENEKKQPLSPLHFGIIISLVIVIMVVIVFLAFLKKGKK